MKRSPLPRRTRPIGRSAPVRKRNQKRRDAEFARCYHSEARVAFVQSLPCVACCNPRTFSLNAHITGDGMSRKAHYTQIIPLCFECHDMQHVFGATSFAEHYRLDVEALAAALERAWREFSGETE